MTEANSSKQPQFKVCEIRSRAEDMEIARKAVLGELEGFSYSERALFGIKLALEEALCNAMKHGNQHDSSKKITVRYAISAEKAEVIVRDEGEGFIPEEVPDPTTPDRIPIPSGRGIMLIRAYMDEVEYRDKGREIYFVKHCKSQP